MAAFFPNVLDKLLSPNFLEGVRKKYFYEETQASELKKSVAFIAELTQDDKVQCRGICAGCNNLDCSNRMEDGGWTQKRLSVMTDMPLTYGYGPIFGLI